MDNRFPKVFLQIQNFFYEIVNARYKKIFYQIEDYTLLFAKLIETKNSKFYPKTLVLVKYQRVIF